MSKFTMFTRSALASAVAAVGIMSGEPKGPAEDPDAGPEPETGEEGEGADDEGADAGSGDMPAKKKKDCAGSDEGAEAAAAAGDVVAVADAVAVTAEAAEAARKAESARWTSVLTSETGKANMQMAVWMLQSSPSASADEIVAQLKTCPAGAGAAASIPDTNVDLGNAAANAVRSGSGGASADDPWAESAKRVHGGGAAVVPSDNAAAAAAALAAGANLVSTPVSATPAVPPTGN